MENIQKIANVQTTASVSDLINRGGRESFVFDDDIGEKLVESLREDRKSVV